MYPDSLLQWLGYTTLIILILGLFGTVVWYFTREKK